MVGDPEGVWATRTLHRQPMASRWNCKEARVLMQGIPRDVSKEDGPYQNPEDQNGGLPGEHLARWDEERPAPASSRRARGLDEEGPYSLRYERENAPTDEDEPAAYPYGDTAVSSRTRAGLRREAEETAGTSSGNDGQVPGAAAGRAGAEGGAEGPSSPVPPRAVASEQPLSGEQDSRPMIEGGPPKRGVVPMLGDSSADEEAGPADAPAGRTSGRKLLITK